MTMPPRAAAMLHHCPNCGCSLRRFEPVSYGNVAIDRDGEIRFCGFRVRLAKTQRKVVEALIQARGRYLTRGILAEVVNPDINDSTINKYIERARAAFLELDPEFDQIEAIRGFGAYKWRSSSRRQLAADRVTTRRTGRILART